MNINFDELKKQALKKWLKLDKYKIIMDIVNKYKAGIEISEEEENAFKTNYITYYDMFRKSKKWQQEFFVYFKKCVKEDKHEIGKILDALETLDKEYDIDKTSKVELSFASKLLATLDPDMPVWDSNVAKKLGEDICREAPGLLIKRKSGYIISENKMQHAKDLYPILVKIEKERLKEYEKEIKKFKEYFKDEYDLTDTKILDFFLWKLK